MPVFHHFSILPLLRSVAALGTHHIAASAFGEQWQSVAIRGEIISSKMFLINALSDFQIVISDLHCSLYDLGLFQFVPMALTIVRSTTSASTTSPHMARLMCPATRSALAIKGLSSRFNT